MLNLQLVICSELVWTAYVHGSNGYLPIIDLGGTGIKDRSAVSPDDTRYDTSNIRVVGIAHSRRPI